MLRSFYDSKVLHLGVIRRDYGVLQGKPELTVGGFFLTLKVENFIYKESNSRVPVACGYLRRSLTSRCARI